MDKIAANNLIVSLRKEIKKAKSMVAGNLIRKINSLKTELQSIKDQAQIEKVNNKIIHISHEVKLLKTLDNYEISKKALLIPDVKIWAKTIGDSKASPEDRLIGRVVQKNAVQKLVSGFVNDHKEYMEWFNEYLEYRDKKKDWEKDKLDKKATAKQSKNSRVKKGAKSRSAHPRYKADRVRKREKVSNGEEPALLASSPEISDEASDSEDISNLHPSWVCKKKEKELLKAALSGNIEQPKKITF